MPTAARSHAPESSAKRYTQAERSARSEERLLDAALALIGERGYERTTLAAIGERAGYSRGLVSHRYGSKAGLLAALLQQAMSQWHRNNVVPAVAADVGLDALRAVLDLVRAEWTERPDILRALNTLLFDPHPEIRASAAALHAELRADIEGAIARGVECGALRDDIDAGVQAALFVGQLRGALYQWTLEPEAVDLGTLFEAQLAQLRASLKAPRS